MSSPSESHGAASASSASVPDGGSSEAASGGRQHRKARAGPGRESGRWPRRAYRILHRWSLRLPDPVRRVGRALWHLPDRLLHARRRRRAFRRLAQRPRPRSLLFVCVGNVCRSPYAERVLGRELPGRVAAPGEIRSAGFSGWDHAPPSEAVDEAARRGIDLSAHRSRALAYDLIDSTDLFVVTASDQARRLERRFGVDPDRIVHLGDLDPGGIRTRDVEDPWGKDPDVFRSTFDRIDRCVERLAEALAAAGGGHGG